MTNPQLFLTATYADAARARAFLAALGFTESLVVPNEADPTIVEHAELRWRETGGLMFGSVREGNPHAGRDAVGTARCYLVVDSDAEVDAAYERALAAGGTSVAEPVDQPYGSREATVADPEGNQFCVGSYAGA